MNKQITSIQVLGSGCPTCKRLLELTRQAVADLGLELEVGYLTDIQEIMEMGVMSLPALAINGQVVLAGQMPKIEKIKELITNN